MIATTAFPASTLASPAGTIARAVATPDWTHGTVAGSVTWSDCTAENHCKWFPEVVTEPSLPEYHCASKDALSSDPNVRSIWNGGSHTTNETVNFEAPNTLILQGVFGQRACLMAIYNSRYREPLCIAQWEVFVNFDKENGLPPPEPLEIFCPLVDHNVMASIAAALFTVEQQPVVTPPVVTLPVVTPPVVTPPVDALPVVTPLVVTVFATAAGVNPSTGIGTLTAGCGATTESCTFTLTLFATVKNGHASAATRVKVGAITGKVQGGASGKLAIKLNAAGRRFLKHGSMHVEAKGSVKSTAGQVTPFHKRITIKKK
jgi:hypothetical protein